MPMRMEEREEQEEQERRNDAQWMMNVFRYSFQFKSML